MLSLYQFEKSLLLLESGTYPKCSQGLSAQSPTYSTLKAILPNLTKFYLKLGYNVYLVQNSLTIVEIFVVDKISEVMKGKRCLFCRKFIAIRPLSHY